MYTFKTQTFPTYTALAALKIFIWCIFIIIHFKAFLISLDISFLTCGLFRRILFNIYVFDGFWLFH